MSAGIGIGQRARLSLAVVAAGLLVMGLGQTVVAEAPLDWKREWPRTDFAKTTVSLGEIRSVIGRDRIPSIDSPRFVANSEAPGLGLADSEPVISVVIGGEARAYPLRILTWHEIVNDTVGGRSQ